MFKKTTTLVLFILFLNACTKKSIFGNADINPTTIQMPKAQVGRYQIVQLGQMRMDQFLLDTETGNIWRATCVTKQRQNGQCDVGEWLPENVININATYQSVNEEVSLLHTISSLGKKSKNKRLSGAATKKELEKIKGIK